MKSLPMALLLCLTVTCGFSQTEKINFKIGEEYELPRGSVDASFFGSEKDGLVNMFLTKKKSLITYRFDPKSLSKTGESEIEKPELTRRYESVTVLHFANKFIWLHSDYNKDDQTDNLYYDEIDVKKGNIIKADIPLLSTSKLANASTQSRYSDAGDKYDVILNANEDKMLVSYRHVPVEKRDKYNYDILGFTVVDQNMNKLWSKDFKMPYTEAVMDNYDYAIDKDGNAYLLSKVYDNEKRREVDKETDGAGYHFEVMKFSGDGTLKQINITLDNYFIKEATLLDSKDGQLTMACTYSKKSRAEGVDGIYITRISEDGQLNKISKGTYEFPTEELRKYEKKRLRKRIDKADDYEIPYLKVRHIQTDPDGSVVVICEQYHMELRRRNNSSMGTGISITYGSNYDRDYYYDDIIVTKISSKGELLWVRKVPKQQTGTNHYSSLGFKFISDSAGYYFMYMDNAKNLELEEDELPKKHIDLKANDVFLVSIDQAGNMKREVVFDSKKEKLWIFPRSFSPIDSRNFVGRAGIKGPGAYVPVLISVH